jgi:hypothetical protein
MLIYKRANINYYFAIENLQNADLQLQIKDLHQLLVFRPEKLLFYRLGLIILQEALLTIILFLKQNANIDDKAMFCDCLLSLLNKLIEAKRVSCKTLKPKL